MHRFPTSEGIAAGARLGLVPASASRHGSITDLLLRHSSREAASAWTRGPAPCVQVKRLGAGNRLIIRREFHSNRTHRSNSNPNAKDEAPGSEKTDLFSWSSKLRLKDASRFDYSQPSSPRPITEVPKDTSDLLSAKPLLIGFEKFFDSPPHVPYSAEKSPLEPFLRPHRGRLNELIQSGTAPDKGPRLSAKKTAAVEELVQEIMQGLIPPIKDPKISSEIRDNVETALSTSTEEAEDLSLSSAPSSTFPEIGQVETTEVEAEPAVVEEQLRLQEVEHAMKSSAEESETEAYPPSSILSTLESETIALEKMPEVDEQEELPTMTEASSELPQSSTVIDTWQEDDIFESSFVDQPPTEKEEVSVTVDKQTPPELVSPMLWDGTEVLAQPEKIILSRDKRLNLITPPIQKLQADLLKLIADVSVPNQEVVLIYSQIDLVHGIDVLPDPKTVMDSMLVRMATAGADWTEWLFTHKSIRRLEHKHLLSPSFSKIMTRALVSLKSKEVTRSHNQVLDNPLSLSDSRSQVHEIWNKMRWHVKRREQLEGFKDHAPLPLPSAKIILEQSIELLQHGIWVTKKRRAVGACIYIFRYYFGNKKANPSLVFSELVRFLWAWQKHWRTPDFLRQNKMNLKGPDERFVHPGFTKLLESMPEMYIKRLMSTLMLRSVVKGRIEIESWLNTGALGQLVSLARPRGILELKKDDNDPARNNQAFPAFREPIVLYELVAFSRSPKIVAELLKDSSDVEIVNFHLRTWPVMTGVRYFDDPALLDEIRQAMGHVAECIKAKYTDTSKIPGLPFAQAILSLFYLNLPTELFLINIFSILDRLGKTEQLKSCLDILSHFEGKYNGDTKFKIPKQGTSIALQCFRKTNLPWALELLMHYHNRHNRTFEQVVLAAASEYPNQCHVVFREFLKPLCVISVWNPQIEYQKQAGWPSRSFLVRLAIKYALSNHHSPNSATRKILFLRHLMRRFGYGISMRVARALVATAMIRTSTHRLWMGPKFENIPDLFHHGRLKLAIVEYMKDAEVSKSYLAGLTPAEAERKKQDFIERCIKEVWAEIDKWKRYQFALATKQKMKSSSVI